MKPDLLVAPCDYKAAKFAVEHWHYSGCMPAGKLVKFGVWEDGQFIGAVIFGRGANNHIGNPYGLDQSEVCELVRVALINHKTTVSKIVRVSLRLLNQFNNNLRLVVSYADPLQNHVGTIYQAMSWVYVGHSQKQLALFLNGEIMHKRTGNALYGTIKGIPKSDILVKHKYLYPLDKAMRRQIEPLRQPYPKREDVRAIDGNTSGVQPEDGGSTPTRPLEVIE